MSGRDNTMIECDKCHNCFREMTNGDDCRLHTTNDKVAIKDAILIVIVYLMIAFLGLYAVGVL